MDKRPLGFIGAVFFLTMLILSRIGIEKALYVFPIFLIVVFLVYLKRKKLKFFAVIASSVLCASLIFSVADINFHADEVYFSGENMLVEGVVYEKPYIKNEKQYIVVKTDTINSEKVSVKIRVTAINIPEIIDFNSKVRFRANLYKVSDNGTSSSSLKADQICLVGGCKGGSFTYLGEGRMNLRYYLMSLRYRMCDTIYSLFPNDIGGFIAGVFLGEKDMMSDELIENFRITGTSHILVVSGLHVAMWSGFLYKCLSLFLKRKYASVCSILFLIVYMIFAGFTPSVVRAGTMMILNYIAIVFGEKPDSLNTLGISAIVLTSLDPFSLYSVGTVYSYASVLGILLMHEYVYKKFRFSKIGNKALRKASELVLSTVLVSLSAQIFTFPVSVLYNINFSFLSVVVNFPLSLVSSFAMVSGGFGTMMLTFLPESVIGRFLMSMSAYVSKFIIHIVSEFAQFRDLYINVSDYENYILISLTAILIILLFISSRKNKIRLFSLLMIPVLFLSQIASAIYKYSFVEFSVIDVGYGLCVTFKNEEECVMFGCGGTYYAYSNITQNLERSGVKEIDTVYLPVNGSMSQLNLIRDIDKTFPVKTVITSPGYSFTSVTENCVSESCVKAEYFDGNMTVEFYSGEKSAFALVTTGKTRILINFYGKLSKENLPQGCINPDIYVTMYKNAYLTDASYTDKYIVSSAYAVAVPSSAKDVFVTMNDGSFTKPILIQEI